MKKKINLNYFIIKNHISFCVLTTHASVFLHLIKGICKMLKAETVEVDTLKHYDLIGFGSGKFECFMNILRFV